MANTYLLREPPKADPVMVDNIRKLNYFIQEVIKNNNKLNLNYNKSSQVKVSANDTTADYLDDKLVAGTGVTLTENADGNNESITISSIATHTGLTDMPSSTNTDHDVRYVAQQSAAAPTTPTPYEGMFWYDTDEPEPEIFLIGDGAAGVDFQIKVDGQTNDGVLVWKEDEDYFEFADDVVMDETLTVAGATTLAAVSATSFNIICCENQVVCYENEVVTWI